jgi:hypothetical protein
MIFLVCCNRLECSSQTPIVRSIGLAFHTTSRNRVLYWKICQRLQDVELYRLHSALYRRLM